MTKEVQLSAAEMEHDEGNAELSGASRGARSQLKGVVVILGSMIDAAQIMVS